MSAAAPRSVLCVVGARPNLIKMAPILNAFAACVPPILTTLVHTGQHSGETMNGQYFTALALPQPDFNLAVGSGSHALQTSAIMARFEPVLDSVAPDAVLVAGDVNSTLACALVAQKKGVPVLHVEAGLRSFDRSMPEEINRLLTDQLSELLFTSEASGDANLLREGVDGRRIRFVGNVMIDSLLRNLPQAVPLVRQLQDDSRAAMFAPGAVYAVITVHRPANVDGNSDLQDSLELIAAIAQRLPVILPLHPRTRAMIARHGKEAMLDQPGLLVTEPLGYLEMLGAMAGASVVLTDSGGLQE
jgi:UDP-N-acetylglucosamine 2-epimerase (non-hydrolysing)